MPYTEIYADSLAIDTEVMVHLNGDRGSSKVIIEDIDDTEDSIVLWCRVSEDEDVQRVEFPPAAMVPVVKLAPSLMTTPQLVREYADLHWQATTRVAHVRNSKVVTELRSRGVLD